MGFRFVFCVFLTVIVFQSCSTPYSVDRGMEVVARRDQQRKGEEFNKRLFRMAVSVGGVEYKLGPGDVVVVSVFGVDELSDMEGQLDSQGRVYLPLVGKVSLEGLTVSGAQKVLEKAYSNYIKSPKVSIFIKEYRSYRVSVLGRVNKPDVYTLRGGRTILDVLAMAGGLTDDASHSIILISPSRGKSEVIDLDSLVGNSEENPSMSQSRKPSPRSLILNSGDVVYIPRADSIFVDGYVNHPGSFPLSNPLTLTQAIALAGGMRDEADSRNVYIYRLGNDGRRFAVRVDLDEIRSGKMQDPLLQNNDVVLVPSSGSKVFVHKFLGFFGIGFSRATSGGSYGVSVGNR